MPSVVLQPAGGPQARTHYVDTIEHPVSLDRMAPLLHEADVSRLGMLYGTAPIPTWGVTPALNGRNVGRWERMALGDVVLFARNRLIHASAIVTHKAHNAPLAEGLWGRDEKEQTWEYMYFLESVVSREIPYSELNRAVPYAKSKVVQGFEVLNEAQSANVLAAFDFTSPDSDQKAAPTEIQELRRAATEAAGKPTGHRRTTVPYEVRRAIELHAMSIAESHFSSQGWDVEDVSAFRSYDLLCRRDGEELHVEVKGTVSDGSAVALTLTR